jgi:hypothetical protein
MQVETWKELLASDIPLRSLRAGTHVRVLRCERDGQRVVIFRGDALGHNVDEVTLHALTEVHPLAAEAMVVRFDWLGGREQRKVPAGTYVFAGQFRGTRFHGQPALYAAGDFGLADTPNPPELVCISTAGFAEVRTFPDPYVGDPL